MSVKLMAEVWTLQLKHGQRDVLLVLADHADDDGNCWPSVPLIAWKTDASQRTVQRQLAGIVTDGLAIVTDEGGGRGRPKRYQLTLENGDKKSPFERAETVTSDIKRVTSKSQKGDTTPPNASEEPPIRTTIRTTTRDEKSKSDHARIMRSLPAGLPRMIVGQYATTVRKLLDEGIPPDRVLHAVGVCIRRRRPPSALAYIVADDVSADQPASAYEGKVG